METPSTSNASITSSGGLADGWAWFQQLLLLPLVATTCAAIWLLFITYYHSRWWGFVLTKIANHFIKEGHIHIGSISVSLLSGKLMFRDVTYITVDYACRIQDGLLILRWWRQYLQVGDQDNSQGFVNRVYILLNGVEFHCYNVASVYNDIEKSFQTSKSTTDSQDSSDSSGKLGRPAALNTRPTALDWRDFFGVIKFDIHTGRIVFGNQFVPSVLILSIEDAHGSYTTNSPLAPWDFFMHEILCEAEQFKLILAPSPKFDGPTDEPPRYMGEGFVVVQSNTLYLHYSQDEAGYVPLRSDCAADELIPPCWALDVTCGAGTNISYGPWADRQRDALQKFFFPQAFKTHEVTPKSRPGQKRQFTTFEFRLNTVAEATIDILFSKDKETNAVHIDVDKASYVEVSIPLLVGSEGYHTRVTGQLLHVDSSTSMEYRSLIESETLQSALIKCLQ
ncbi:transmembrane protein KIAA1109 homolog [Asterias rubens]|uniref:transmembrane protein KIAA1109 homolog n=1 Tax=Asterias rubens TaxID=7604 RepID=UPI0014555FF3|nr:transmembrane protein KIAA1109 homolog [Asterias rubens]